MTAVHITIDGKPVQLAEGETRTVHIEALADG